jgi:hypothetical protein
MRERSEKVRLTDLKVAALKPKLGKSQYDVFDDDNGLPGFGIRITSTGTRTFMLLARFPGSKSAARRAIGTYPKISLAKARRIAEEWLSLIKQGTDPAAKQREEAEAAERAKSKLEMAKFESVAERFIIEYVSTTRRADTAAREIRREFIKPWGHKAITDIEAADVLAVIKGVLARGAKYQARNLLIEAKTASSTVARLFGGWLRRASFPHRSNSVLPPSHFSGRSSGMVGLAPARRLCALQFPAARPSSQTSHHRTVPNERSLAAAEITAAMRQAFAAPLWGPGVHTVKGR